MSKQLGFSRLYQAVNLSSDTAEMNLKLQIGDVDFNLYIGPNPIFGITILEFEGRYLLEDQTNVIPHSHFDQVEESPYSGSIFTEISCFKSVEDLNDEINSENFTNFIDDSTKETFDNISTLLAGTLGLRIHKQFVLKLIGEKSIYQEPGKNFIYKITSNFIELLRKINLNEKGEEGIRLLVKAIENSSKQDYEKEISSLNWLLRAWHSQDPFEKFISLFISLEVILNGIEEEAERRQDRRRKLRRIRSLIQHNSTEEERGSLIELYDIISGNARQTLNDKFKNLAKKANFSGWERDIEAFREFYRMRNMIVHKGDEDYQFVIADSKIKDANRNLEDIAERYLSWVLFEDHGIYPSLTRINR